MSDRIIEGSAKFLCAAVELAMGRIDLCKCSACGGPRDNGWMCGECGEGYCDPITEDCHVEAAAHAINSHDNLTNQVADLNLELACVYKNLKSAYARAAISREKSIVQIDELRAALGEIKNITGKLSGQNPANFCEEVAMEHDAATFQIYEISNKALCKALKDGEL